MSVSMDPVSEVTERYLLSRGYTWCPTDARISVRIVKFPGKFLWTEVDRRREARRDSGDDRVVVLQMNPDRELHWQFWFEMFYASQYNPLHRKQQDSPPDPPYPPLPSWKPSGDKNVKTAKIAKAEEYPIFTVFVAWCISKDVLSACQCKQVFILLCRDRRRE